METFCDTGIPANLGQPGKMKVKRERERERERERQTDREPFTEQTCRQRLRNYGHISFRHTYILYIGLLDIRLLLLLLLHRHATRNISHKQKRAIVSGI